MFFDFKITLGIWLYISAVLLTSACAHLFVNHLAESSQYVNQCLSYCPMQFEAIFTKNIDCWYKLEPPHHLNIRNFDSCDVICGTEVLYSIIRDSDLIYISKMKHCRSRTKGYTFFMLNSAEHEIQITPKSCK